MLSWHHSGFNVYCGNAIWPHNEEGLENLARYIIRASFSQERMTYIPANDSSDGAKVVYEAAIEKILRHLGLWETCNHDPPFRNATHIPGFTYLPVRDRTQTGDGDYSQVPSIDYWLQ